MRKLINFALFYSGWVICAGLHNFFAAILVLALVLANYLIMKYRFKEILVIILIAVLGTANDCLATKLGAFQISGNINFLSLNNTWLFALWMLFATTFNSSLQLLKRYKFLVLSILGACGGTISYYAAIKFGVFYTNHLFLTLGYIALNWMILFPCLFRLYNFLV